MGSRGRDEGPHDGFGLGGELYTKVARNKLGDVAGADPRTATGSAPFPRSRLGNKAALEAASQRKVRVDGVEGFQELRVAVPAVGQVYISECPVGG